MTDPSTTRRLRKREVCDTYARKMEAASSSPAHASERWILQFHDGWSRLTHSAFYTLLGERRLSNEQFSRWLVDQATISLAVHEAATRMAERLCHTRGARESLPLLGVAREDAAFLYHYADRLGMEMGGGSQMSAAAQTVVRLFDEVTREGVDVAVGLSAVWGYMLGSWTGWSLCKRRGQGMGAHFAPVCDFVARMEAVKCLVASQELLNGMLQRGGAAVGERGRRVFEEVVEKTAAVLDATVGLGDGAAACVCGRKGHVSERCTFKSRV